MKFCLNLQKFLNYHFLKLHSLSFYLSKGFWLVWVGWTMALTPALAQKSINKRVYETSARKVAEKIVVDGDLTEAIWQTSTKVGDFFQNFPFDSSFANTKTEVMIAFDDSHLYFAFICYDDHLDQPFVVQSLRRDYDGGRNDFVSVYLDTFSDGANGFGFGVTPLNVQREVLIADGGENVNTDWDNKWYSATKVHDRYWVAEMAIPFKTLRYREGNAPWKLNFARRDLKTNETSTWVPVPRNFRLSSLAFTGTLYWDEPLKKPGLNAAIIPYITGGNSANFVENKPERQTYGVGADAKIALTSSLNLDLTFNPDFSQVEVDRQVTNLDRFEIFFPERRQFFLENSDLFSRFGFSRIRPFFSRRIGIGFDTTLKQIVQTPIIYGVRLSGKLDENWRVGFLNMQTARTSGGIEGQNYTVATFQRKVFSRSNIGGIFVNRQMTSDSSSSFSFNIPNFNRVVGVDYNLLSKDNRWRGKFFYHQAITPQQLNDQYAHASYLSYQTPRWEINWNHEYVGKNYVAEVGFVPRRNHWRFEPSVFHTIYTKRPKSKINNYGFGVYTNFFWNTSGSLTDRTLQLAHFINFKNTAEFSVRVNQEYILLFNDFDPTNTGGERLLAGSDYTVYNFSVNYAHDRRKLFNWGFGMSGGQYFNGSRLSGGVFLNYRVQPILVFNLSADYNRIEMPLPYRSVDLVLISPRVDLTLTRNVFLTAFAQYNNQIENINLNARLQWRFKPVSDLFVVYTDNYFPENLRTKSSAIVLKLTYWLSI
ncbi:MAG TPA: hypothetical protein DCM08_08445 [Microscillaceae bacterium]|nr:hypothetical protein [Microscillaceae bacterium]